MIWLLAILLLPLVLLGLIVVAAAAMVAVLVWFSAEVIKALLKIRIEAP